MAERAAYSSSDGQIVFTGEPRWQAPNLEGSAEQLIANTFTNYSLFAQNNVVVRYTLEPGSKSLFDFFPNESAPVATTNAPVTIEIKSRTFSARASDREGIFLSGVKAQQIPADGAQPRLASDSLTLKLTPGGAKSRAESYRAHGNVVVEQGTPGVTNGAATYRRMNAENVTARMLTNGSGALDTLVADGSVKLAFKDSVANAGRATYTASNQLFMLTGNPTMTNSQVDVYEAENLVWDKVHESVRSDHPMKSRVKTEGFKLEGLQPNLQLPTLPKK
jgi:lipopolysaccharide export system protein LptA